MNIAASLHLFGPAVPGANMLLDLTIAQYRALTFNMYGNPTEGMDLDEANLIL